MLTIWNPLNDLVRMNRFFDDYASDSWSASGGGWCPRVDIKEEEKSFVVTAELPGVDPKDVSVELKEGVLTISGEKKFEHEEKNDTYHKIERSYGSFSRSFSLSDRIDDKKIEAKFKEGLLTLTLPKKEKSKTKKIPVKN